MLALALALLLAAPPDDTAAEARAELDACAARIEALKARRARGEVARRELERLLVRAQELAAQLQRARAELPPVPLAPSAEELRERADWARDDADRLSAEIAELDVKIADGRRILGPGPGGVARAGLAGRSAAADHASRAAADRLAELAARRAQLALERAQAEETAARLEAEARAADAAR